MRLGSELKRFGAEDLGFRKMELSKKSKPKTKFCTNKNKG